MPVRLAPPITPAGLREDLKEMYTQVHKGLLLHVYFQRLDMLRKFGDIRELMRVYDENGKMLTAEFLAFHVRTTQDVFTYHSLGAYAGVDVLKRIVHVAGCTHAKITGLDGPLSKALNAQPVRVQGLYMHNGHPFFKVVLIKAHTVRSVHYIEPEHLQPVL